MREHEKNYAEEFKIKNKCKVFDVGQEVLIKNEAKENKMDKEYKQHAVVVANEKRDVYLIRNNYGKILRRHGSQLRVWPGNVGYGKSDSISR